MPKPTTEAMNGTNRVRCLLARTRAELPSLPVYRTDRSAQRDYCSWGRGTGALALFRCVHGQARRQYHAAPLLVEEAHQLW